MCVCVCECASVCVCVRECASVLCVWEGGGGTSTCVCLCMTMQPSLPGNRGMEYACVWQREVKVWLVLHCINPDTLQVYTCFT